MYHCKMSHFGFNNYVGLMLRSYLNAKIKIISEIGKQAVDKLTPTSQSTVPTPQGSCSIRTYGEERAMTEPQMKIKK